MSFQQSESGVVTVLSVTHARLDAAVAEGYREALARLIEAGKVKLCINLERVQFIDSSGLNVLIIGTRTAREKKGGLAVACPQPQVKDMFEMTRVNRMIPVFATQDDAVRSLS